MEGIVDKLGWKKSAAILVGLALVGIIFSVLSFSNSEKQIQSVGVKTGVKNDQVGKGSTSGDNNNLPSSATPAQKLKTYTTSHFQISYPDNYNGVLYDVSKGILDHVNLEDVVTAKKIEIVVFDASTGLSQLSRPFEAFKYAKSSVGLNALTGTMYKGSVGATGLNELVVLVPKNNTTIRVMTTYTGNEDANFENEFKSIVRTLN